MRVTRYRVIPGRLEAWLEGMFAGQACAESDDLHIDEIFRPMPGRSDWIPLTIRAFRDCRELRDRVGAKVSVAVAFPLQEKCRHWRGFFRNVRELDNELTHQPPSLFYFRHGYRYVLRNTSTRTIRQVKLRLFEEDLPGVRYYYSESEIPDDDDSDGILFARWLWCLEGR